MNSLLLRRGCWPRLGHQFASSVVLVLFLLATNVNSTLAQELSAEEVRKSIDSGVRFLYSKQQSGGGWLDSDKRYKHGDTALVALALLNCGESPKDARLQKAIRALNSLPQERLKTYTVAMRIMVLAAADPVVHKPKIRKDVAWLLERQIDKGNDIGGWGYPSGTADGSNTQFALLALHEASNAGIKVDEIYWRRSLEYWRKLANRRGSLNYKIDQDSARASMTCAGISSIIIAQENLIDVKELDANGDVACCRTNSQDEMVENALTWLGKAFSVRYHPMSGRRAQRTLHKFYYLYGLERACRLAGRRFLGAHDWYREGATELIKLQGINGSWTGAGLDEKNKTIATSFALLFLAKGKRPVAIGKFKIGENNDWDRHPKGVHFLTRKLEECWSTKLNWQTIDGNKAQLKDLLEAPVLFISGRDRLDLTQQQKQLLKEYVESGNFIFAEANEGNGCGENSEFDRKFRALMAELFPETELEPLAADHPIWNSYHQLSPRPDWVVYGLQACCRTSVVYVQRSLSGHWQMNRPRAFEQLPKRAAEQIEYATDIGVNVVSYATGRQLRDKLDLPTVESNQVKILSNRALVLPKLMHNGGSDDAPNAWRKMLDNASTIGLRIDTTKKLIPAELESLADHPFVFMHGRNKFKFTDKQRKALRKYLDGGNRGFIFCDSICTSKAFTDSFRKEMRAIFPEHPLEKIPSDHPIWSDGEIGFGGYPIKTVTISKPNREKKTGFETRQVTPQLEGIEIDGRLCVVFSPFDISCALENSTVSQCEGYTREDANKICINVLLYRLNRD